MKLEKGLSAKRQLYYAYKKIANKRKIFFDLSFEEFIELTEGDCFYCGQPPSNEFGKTQKYIYGSYIYNGVDRIDNDKGYILSNCVSCCKYCNRAKQDLTLKEFLELINRIYTKHKFTLDLL